MQKVVNLIDGLNDRLGRGVSYFNHLLVWLICIDVLMRYFFSASQIWIMELEIYFYAFLFLLGTGFAFRHDRHVRVDVFYTKMSPRGKAIVDLLGGILFLMPWSLIVMWVSWDYAAMSFKIGEGVIAARRTTSDMDSKILHFLRLSFSLPTGYIIRP